MCDKYLLVKTHDRCSLAFRQSKKILFLIFWSLLTFRFQMIIVEDIVHVKKHFCSLPSTPCKFFFLFRSHSYHTCIDGFLRRWRKYKMDKIQNKVSSVLRTTSIFQVHYWAKVLESPIRILIFIFSFFLALFRFNC